MYLQRSADDIRRIRILLLLLLLLMLMATGDVMTGDVVAVQGDVPPG